MYESMSESENELFESAEESLDENEEKTKGKEWVKDKSLQNLGVAKPAACSTNKISNEILSEEKESTLNYVAYRKRPEKPRTSGRKLSSKALDHAKIQRTEFVVKSDVISTDNLLQDLKTNLSKNINKSLNTIQQTSSNVKDLILSTLPVSDASTNDVFSYDDGSSVSTPPEPDLMSGSFSSLSLSDMIINASINCLEMIADEETTSEYSNISANQIEEELMESFKMSSKIPANNKLFSSYKNNFNIPEIGEILHLDDCKSKTNKEGIRLFTERIASAGGTNFEPPLQRNKTSRESLQYEHMVLEKNHSSAEHKQKMSEKLTSLSAAKVDGKLPLPIVKSKFIKKSSSPDRIKQFEKEAKCGLDINRNRDLEDSIESFKKELTSNTSMGDKKDLISLESCYTICEQLPECDKKSAGKSETRFQLTEDLISVEDPISGWINKTTNTVGEKKNYLDDEKIKVQKSDGNISENKIFNKNMTEKLKFESRGGKPVTPEKNVSSLCHVEVRFGGECDDWEDFDFSDNEDISSETSVLTKDESPNRNDKQHNNVNEVIKNKDSIATSFNYKKSINDVDVVRSEKGITEKKSAKVMKNNNDNETGDDWGWDNWGDEEEPNQKQDRETKAEEYSSNLDGEIWSGWDTFGQKQDEKQSNWGAWGVNMLLDKASAVTQGLSSALESSLGAPNAQTLARMDYAKEKKVSPEQESHKKVTNASSDLNLFSSFGITDLVAGVTSKIVDHTKFQEIGSKVITGGLDTLESFGKKTMEVLQDGDPGLRSKRALLMGSNKPVLSQVLKEIRDKTEKELKKVEEREMERKCHFESIFDDFQGLVHLEALEMLSKQCELKLEQIRSSMTPEEQDDLDVVLEEVEQLCFLDDYDLTQVLNLGNFKDAVRKAVVPLKDEIQIQKIFEVQEDAIKWLESSTSSKDLSSILVQHKLVSILAQLTASIVHQFHKVGELLSVKECRKTVEEIDALSEMTHILISEISSISNSFITLSKVLFRGTENMALIVNKIDEVKNNSTTYIKQAFNLLIPVLQVGAAV